MREHSSKYVERWRSPSDLGYAAGCAQRGIARDQSGTLVVYSVAILLEATAGQSACRGLGYVSRVPTEAAAAAGAMHIQRAHVHGHAICEAPMNGDRKTAVSWIMFGARSKLCSFQRFVRPISLGASVFLHVFPCLTGAFG